MCCAKCRVTLHPETGLAYVCHPGVLLRMLLFTFTTKGHSHGLRYTRVGSIEVLSHRMPLSWLRRGVWLAKVRDLGGKLGVQAEKRCSSGMQKALQMKRNCSGSKSSGRPELDIVCQVYPLDSSSRTV